MFVATKHVFCRDKSKLVATKLYFQKHDKSIVATKDVFCRDKHMSVATKVLSQLTYLWQLPPMIYVPSIAAFAANDSIRAAIFIRRLGCLTVKKSVYAHRFKLD